MTVEQIKAKAPEAEVHELRKDSRYLVIIPHYMRHEDCESMHRTIIDAGLAKNVVLIIGLGVKIYQLEDNVVPSHVQ